MKMKKKFEEGGLSLTKGIWSTLAIAAVLTLGAVSPTSNPPGNTHSASLAGHFMPEIVRSAGLCG